MFSKVLKSSIRPLLRSTNLKNFLNVIPTHNKSLTALSIPFYNFSSSASFSSAKTQSPVAQVHKAMKEFINKENYNASDVVTVLDQLERSKKGINSSDPLYKDFMVKLNDAVKNKFTARSYEAIAVKAFYLNIKDPLFWFSLDNSVKTAEENMDFQTLLILFSIFLRVKSYPHFYRYVSGFKDEFMETVKKILPQLEFRHVIHASYIFGSLSTPFPDLTKKLKSDLASSLKNPNSVDVSINDLATAGVLISTILKESDADRATLLRDLGNFFNTLDFNQFIQPSQSSQTGLAALEEQEELLNWQSVAFLVRIFYTSSAPNQALVQKLRDVILAKSEIDPVDFESASIILSVLVSAQKEADHTAIEKILETVQTQLAEEGSAMFSQFDGRNVASFVKTVTTLAKRGKNKEVAEEFVEYFSGLVRSDKIASKIELEDYQILRRVFEDAKNVAPVNDELFTHIQNRIERVKEQQKRESR